MRWKLLSSHYLRVPGTEWEYKEVDQQTGRERRKRIEVDRYLDINDPSDFTTRGANVNGMQLGEVTVCHEGKGLPTDHIFTGNPTPEMEPLDEEAEALSNSLKDGWAYKGDGETDYNQALIKMQTDAAARPQTVQIEGMAELLQGMTAIMTRLAEQPARRV